ncbi:MAG: TM2 domain-containing protein [Bacteroidales bacterium]|nr:TM2 domain-containing protein [Bacteroidales bacterium]
MNANLYQMMPELDMQEMTYVDSITKNYTDQQMLNFANFYRSRRRDPQMILLATLAGFLGFAGIQRFLTDQIGMGILYFFTVGLCFIGTIIDLINYRQMALEYNIKVANEVSGWIARMQQ